MYHMVRTLVFSASGQMVRRTRIKPDFCFGDFLLWLQPGGQAGLRLKLLKYNVTSKQDLQVSAQEELGQLHIKQHGPGGCQMAVYPKEVNLFYWL